MEKIISIVMILTFSTAVQVANADFTFGTPTNLGNTVNSGAHDAVPSISADGLVLFFQSNRSGGSGTWDIWVATRETIDDNWSTVENLGPTVNSPYVDSTPSISADGLSLYFSSERPGGAGAADLWVTTRVSVPEPWGPPVNLGPTVNSPFLDWSPSISSDGLELFMHSDRPSSYGGDELWVARRETTSDDWRSPVNLGPIVNSPSLEATPSISSDGLVLFFQSIRPGGYGGVVDIWMTRRATKDDPWEEPMNLGPIINSSGWEGNPGISADGSTLYIVTNRSGGFGNSDLWQVPIDPIVDLNDDGIVDADDMCIIVDYWGTDDSLCDIGPMPWGDGIVDVHDLVALAEHLFTCPGTVAHWPLDETEGDIAHDSVATNDAVVFGNVIWQPGGGQVRGALQLDGIDDYLSTDFVLNPMDGAFSVFVWIKGGAPGQVILSQVDTPTERGVKPGSTWLGIDPSEGKLMAGLTHAVLPLKSDFVITDDQWHEIGLVYDGSSKYLYVDGAEVAKDDLRPLLGNDGGLYIGAGKDLEPGTFFSGLIDNVRIYDRAVTP